MDRAPVADQGTQLQVATEELRVATEELEAQQREIDDLISRQGDEQRTLRAVVAAVPVPVVTTNGTGSVVEANASAGALVGLPVPRLVRKPLQAYVAASSRRAVRSLLSEAVRSGSASARIEVVPRHALAVPVDVAVSAVTAAAEPDRARLSWVLVPAPEGAGAGRADDGQGGGQDSGQGGGQALRAIAELCHLPVGEVGVEAVLQQIAVLATRAVGAAGWSSVTLGDPSSPAHTATDSLVAQQADGAQWRAGEGPCWQAYADRSPVVSGDLRRDARWPDLVRHLGASPVVSVLGVPVLVDGVDGPAAGVLNIYSADEDGLSGEVALDRALVFTAAAGAVLQDARRMQELRSTAEQLQQAMRSRAPIEQAKGVVAGWLDCEVEEAFEVLASLSQDRNVKLRELAVLVVGSPVDRLAVRPLLVQQRDRLRRRPA